MMKAEYNGELLLYTCPTVLITSRYETDNVFTVSWTGIASSHPEYVTVAINKKRLSHEMISRTKKFCINIPDTRLLREVDYCGSYSGRDVDKFVNCKFEKIYFDSDYVLIKQCKFHIICNVESIIHLGSHDLFIAKVVRKLIDEDVQNMHEDAEPIVYFRPNYYSIDRKALGYYGFSTNKDLP